jgi:rifampicin phosphotransferase
MTDADPSTELLGEMSVAPLQLFRLGGDQSRDRSLTGAKAAALAELWSSLDGRIPPGVVVPATHSAVFLLDPDQDRYREAAAALRAAATDIGANRWAVRSSAVEEDGDDRSYAGQFDTVLGVASPDDLPAAVATCVRSVVSQRAEAYRSVSQTSAAPTSPGVLVQAMIAADRSGIAFTRNPVTSAKEIVINAAYGLGDLVVGGRITPDEIIIADPDATPTITIGRKHLMSVLAGSGRSEIPVPASLQSRCSLTNDQIATVARAALDCETFFGHPVDVEWVISRQELYVVQARPITATSPSSEGDLT